MILCALAELERSHGWRFPGALRTLGDASYAIYLVHFSVQTLYGRVILALHLERFVPLPILFVSMVVAGTLAGVAFYRWVEAPVQAVLKRWTAPSMTARAAA